MSKGWATGSTRAWRRIRALVLARDRQLAITTREAWCRLRVPGVCVGESRPMHVHHLDGKAYGDNPARLVSACAPCNLRIGDPNKHTDPPSEPVTRW